MLKKNIYSLIVGIWTISRIKLTNYYTNIHELTNFFLDLLIT